MHTMKKKKLQKIEVEVENKLEAIMKKHEMINQKILKKEIAWNKIAENVEEQ